MFDIFDIPLKLLILLKALAPKAVLLSTEIVASNELLLKAFDDVVLNAVVEEFENGFASSKLIPLVDEDENGFASKLMDLVEEANGLASSN
jgi:hypothetical protein